MAEAAALFQPATCLGATVDSKRVPTDHQYAAYARREVRFSASPRSLPYRFEPSRPRGDRQSRDSRRTVGGQYAAALFLSHVERAGLESLRGVGHAGRRRATVGKLGANARSIPAYF